MGLGNEVGEELENRVGNEKRLGDRREIGRGRKGGWVPHVRQKQT